MSVSYGGQAVLEGVMMRGPSCWAVAVRTPEGGIEEVVRDVTSPMRRHRIWRLPVIRGVIALGESLAIGFRALAISANVATREEVDAVLATARAAGADPVQEAVDRPWGGYTGYFADPDGYRWEIAFNPGPIGEIVVP